MEMQILWNVEPEWKRNKMGFHLESGHVGYHQICSFMWANKFWILFHTTIHLEQMTKELVEEAERWGLEPKLASLWWTSAYADEKKEGMMIKKNTGPDNIPFEKQHVTVGMVAKKTTNGAGVEWRLNLLTKKIGSRVAKLQHCGKTCTAMAA